MTSVSRAYSSPPSYDVDVLCTCHRLAGGGGPRADVGEYGDFMGTLQQISALVVGKCGDLDI